MGRRPKLTKEVKAEIAERYLQGEGPSQLGQIYGFHKDSLRDGSKSINEMDCHSETVLYQLEENLSCMAHPIPVYRYPKGRNL